LPQPDQARSQGVIDMPFGQPDGYEPGLSIPQPLPERSLWFVFRGSELLVCEPLDARCVPLLGRPDELRLTARRSLYLGVFRGEHCFAADVHADVEPPPGWTFRGLRQIFSAADDATLGLAGRALQLVEWDRTHAFCGACGQPTRMRETERARECPQCALVVYPRLAPVVMCLVRRERDFLLARSPRFPKGVFSALAGFVEPGETLEQCVAREVFEEVGLRVSNLRYFASQPWPFPHSLMIAFFADYAGGDIKVDGLEIEAAHWFSVGNLPQLPAKLSIARRLIDAAMGEIAST
jgi:NAD+ diphosphatase